MVAKRIALTRVVWGTERPSLVGAGVVDRWDLGPCCRWWAWVGGRPVVVMGTCPVLFFILPINEGNVPQGQKEQKAKTKV